MLSRDRLEKALESLDWAKVEAVLAAADGGTVDVNEAADVVLKTNALVLRNPAPAAESKRQKLFDSLLTYFGAAHAAKLEEVFSTLRLAEDGYRTIVRALASTEAGKLTAEEHITAAIEGSEREVNKMFTELAKQQAERPYLSQHVVYQDEDGTPVNPNSMLEHMANLVSLTLQMHAHTAKLFDEDGVIVAPLLPSAPEDAVEKTGATLALAVVWRRWENTEERARFLGHSLRLVPKREWPADAPERLQKLVQHSPNAGLELMYQVAYNRMQRWLSQNFFEMSDQVVERLETKDRPGPHKLPPHAVVSRSELHAVLAVSNTVHYDIMEDQERPGGLRLLEWVRGYAALGKLADDTPAAARISKTAEEWTSFLVHWGLTAEAARAFVKALTFRKGSRDLFDHPIIKQASGEYLLYRPVLRSMNISQVVFSTLGQLREPLQKKGDAFEKAVLRLFEKNGIKGYSFTEKRDGEKYQVDALVPWGKYLFLFECKNRSLPPLKPMLMHQFDKETVENIEQVNRIALGLKKHPDILAKHLPPEDRDKEIVPCVLNALPFCIPSDVGGVYVYDFSALSRFFKSAQLMGKEYSRAKGHQDIAPWQTIWSGPTPTPEDLLAQMKASVQFASAEDMLEFVHQGFPLPENWWVDTQDFRAKEHEAIAALAEKVLPAENEKT